MFEVRDRMTFIPVIATKLDTIELPEEEAYLIARSGFGRNCQYIMVTKLIDGEMPTNYDAGGWIQHGTRTMRIAHKHINQHFDELSTGSVIDVEFILGETPHPKRTERLDKYGS